MGKRHMYTYFWLVTEIKLFHPAGVLGLGLLSRSGHHPKPTAEPILQVSNIEAKAVNCTHLGKAATNPTLFV